jgi:hypothetical protein
MRPENALMYSLQERQHNIERLKREQEEQLLKDCNNFKPKINKRSEAIDKLKVDKIKREMEDG